MKLSSICPGCGSPTVEGLCKRCRLESTTLLSCPPRVEVISCPVCGAQRLQGRWQPVDRPVEVLVSEAAERSVEIYRDLANPQVTLTVSKRGATRYIAEVELIGEFEGMPAEDRCTIAVDLRYETCDRCSKMAGRYYEAVVQLRARGRSLSPQEIEECEKIVISQADKSLEKGDRLAFVREMKPVQGGVDIVVGSTQMGRLTARSILDRFGGRMRESYKQVGAKNGKELYRTNILVRLPRLRDGDVVVARGTVLEVRGYGGKRTLCLSLMDGGRVFLSEEEADAARLLGNRSDSQKTVVVAMDEAVLEILDPVSYKTISVTRPGHLEVGPGDEVEVIGSGDDLVLLAPL
ncbi:MAG: 60S ribosomal export protein NMD3 [Euryarchaeota archaeon]|nr:60S ribosomal export protein NMD3 [Euryarchaeota archaeon]